MISVRNLEKRYGDVRAVKDVSFEVGKGDIVGLLGHNGAGKTTVMKIITGFLEPSDGSVSVGGVDVIEDRLGVQSQIGYLPESAPLYPEMLVQEYLLMMAELRGIPARDCEPAVADAVKATGLREWLVRPISTLSKGYRQRVGLAQAIVHKPELLVLDEPTNGLDPVQIVEIRALIRSLSASSTVMLSTHILSEIEAVCNRVVILIDGELAADEDLGTLLESNRVRLSIADAARDVAKRLSKASGVTNVSKVGADPANEGFTIWSAISESQQPSIPELLKIAGEAGWPVAAAGSETANLEQAFRSLMQQHVARRSSDVRKEVAA